MSIYKTGSKLDSAHLLEHERASDLPLYFDLPISLTPYNPSFLQHVKLSDIREEKWVSTIKEKANPEAKALYAVGLAHLKGLSAKLSKTGFSITLL